MKKILIQIDPDPHASVFDSVVAIDSGVDHLLCHGAVLPEQVQSLVHGGIFTRGPKDLHNTAIFVGGSNVSEGEALLEKVIKSFFGPMQFSVMLDANGCNTTAAAAVLRAGVHIDLSSVNALVLGGTGPVGQRVGLLLAKEGASVRLGSRSKERADSICSAIGEKVDSGNLIGVAAGTTDEVKAAIDGCEVVVSAGAAGVELLPEEIWSSANSLKVAIDLNAVPPEGIGGISAFAKEEEKHGVICYGAVGVGGTKMKIHKAAIAALFESNDKVLDAEAIYKLGQSLA